MSKLVNYFSILLLFSAAAGAAFGQTADKPNNRAEIERSIRDEKARIDRKAREDFSNDDSLYPEIFRNRSRMSRKDRKKIESFKKIDKEDLSTYKKFLKNPHTGIFRLYPNFECESPNVLKFSGECANFVPGLWAFSLREEGHTVKDLGDLSFENGKLETGGLLAQGILVSLGKRGIEDVSLETNGLDFLVDFEPSFEKNLIAAQSAEISRGIEKNGFLYSRSLPLEIGAVYALRVIAYDFKDRWSSRFRDRNFDETTRDQFKFRRLITDRRNDSIYALKIIRESPNNGGITIIWKRLSSKDSPKITFEKNEKLADFASEDYLNTK